MNPCTRAKTGANARRGLAVMLACNFAHFAGAASVYKCRDASGDVAYQDHACAAAQQESRVELAAIPAATASPDYGRVAKAHVAKGERAHATIARRGTGEPEALSYECRGDSGSVFYRHSACPKSIHKKSSGRGKGRRGSATSESESESVTGIAMPRSEVCRRLAAGGSIGRGGHERDDQVSTYERNLGRDPCRRS